MHQWHKKGIQCWPSENASKKWNCAKTQNKFWRNTVLSTLMWRKKSIVDETSALWRRLKHLLWSTLISRKKVYYWRSINDFAKIGGSFTRHKNFSLRSMKRREGVFSPKAQKLYVHKSFMHRKEMNFKAIHILHSKPMSTKYYKHSLANVTLIF